MIGVGKQVKIADFGLSSYKQKSSGNRSSGKRKKSDARSSTDSASTISTSSVAMELNVPLLDQDNQHRAATKMLGSPLVRIIYIWQLGD